MSLGEYFIYSLTFQTAASSRDLLEKVAQYLAAETKHEVTVLFVVPSAEIRLV